MLTLKIERSVAGMSSLQHTHVCGMGAWESCTKYTHGAILRDRQRYIHVYRTCNITFICLHAIPESQHNRVKVLNLNPTSVTP